MCIKYIQTFERMVDFFQWNIYKHYNGLISSRFSDSVVLCWPICHGIKIIKCKWVLLMIIHTGDLINDKENLEFYMHITSGPSPRKFERNPIFFIFSLETLENGTVRSRDRWQRSCLPARPGNYIVPETFSFLDWSRCYLACTLSMSQCVQQFWDESDNFLNWRSLT